MIYEWRIYEMVPGKMSNIHKRFSDVTVSLFKKHGFEVVGFWEANVGVNNTLYYMLRFNDFEHYETTWKKFRNDPEKQKTFSESEKDGPIVANIRNQILTPTEYSPLC